MSTEATTMLSVTSPGGGVGSGGERLVEAEPLLPRMQPVQNAGGMVTLGSQLWASGRAQELVQREQGAQLTGPLF